MSRAATPGASGGRVQAGIELVGRSLRYAEAELGASPRLLRMGVCDFEFDVDAAVLEVAGPAYLDTVATALREIFAGSQATRLQVAVHPWHATSFFAPLPVGMAATGKFEQLRQEAAMLADSRVARPVRVTASPVRMESLSDGRRFHWHHVLGLAESVHARAAHLAKRVGKRGEHEFVDAAGAVAGVVARLRSASDRVTEVENPGAVLYTLAFGLYGNRVEVSVCRGAAWHFSHWVEVTEAADAAYFTVALLDRIGVPADRVGSLFLYGDAAGRELLSGVEDLLEKEARPLDAFPLFRRDQNQTDPMALAAFAPCIGAALKEQGAGPGR